MLDASAVCKPNWLPQAFAICRAKTARRDPKGAQADTESSPPITSSGSAVAHRRGDSGPAARADHCIDTSAGDGARTLLCDIERP